MTITSADEPTGNGPEIPLRPGEYRSLREHWRQVRLHRARTHANLEAAKKTAAALASRLTTVVAERQCNAIQSDLEVLQRLKRRLERGITKHEAQRAALHSLQTTRVLTVLQRRESVADDRLYARLTRTLSLLGPVKQCIRELLRFAPAPLYTDDREQNAPVLQRDLVIDRFADLVTELVNPVQQAASAKALGCYSDIPLPASIFLADAGAAFRVGLARRVERPLRFMDVGCGGGTKLLLAAQIFGTVHGLEYDPGYVRAARELLATLNLDEIEVFQADARAFTRYDNYDVLYFFQPMSDPVALHALEDHVAAIARPGTVLIAPYSQFTQRAPQLDCGHIAGNLFLAGASQAKADALAKEATFMGTALTRQFPMAERDFWFLQPIVEALYANAFVPGVLQPQRRQRW